MLQVILEGTALINVLVVLECENPFLQFSKVKVTLPSFRWKKKTLGLCCWVAQTAVFWWHTLNLGSKTLFFMQCNQFIMWQSDLFDVKTRTSFFFFFSKNLPNYIITEINMPAPMKTEDFSKTRCKEKKLC